MIDRGLAVCLLSRPLFDLLCAVIDTFKRMNPNYQMVNAKPVNNNSLSEPALAQQRQAMAYHHGYDSDEQAART